MQDQAEPPANEPPENEPPAAAATLPAAQEPSVQLRVSCVAKLNLADFQNAVPALFELAVVNDTPQAIGELQLRLACEPPAIRPRTWSLDSVRAGETFHVTDLDLALDGAVLSRLTEAETATLRFELGCARLGTERLAVREQTLELLPRHQWGGIGHLPEMVAAFVQPNDPAIDRLLQSAAQALRESGKSPSIEGYAQGARRAWELASGLWTAVLRRRMSYTLPPASFEHAGQKVRSPSQMLDAGLGTCLDLSLLFAACLEQAHLNPLLIFTRGHSFVGLWLRDETFSTTVVDDITAVRKRLMLQELLVFETTLAVQPEIVHFSQAIANAQRQLSEAEEDRFELLVDVKRARMSRIKPLAQAHAGIDPGPAAREADAQVSVEEAPELPDEGLAPLTATPLDPKDRLARWQRKLLDLSLRNALLNFKAVKKAVVLDAPAPALEDALATGLTLKLLPSPQLMEGLDPRSQALHESRSREDLHREHAAEALTRREVFIRLDEVELQNRLVELYRGARLALQEGGANTLFLALGFLLWTRDGKADSRVRAPLVLLPVTLERRSARSGFTLQAHDDEALFNPTLLEMLRQDFQLDLDPAGGLLSRDGAGLDIAGVWKRVRATIRDIPRWEISEEVVLSMFSFSKYLMWKDLCERTQDLRQSPVVEHLIDHPREAYRSGPAFPDARRLDAEFAPQQVFCPLAADSSQLSAVMAASRGKDFVLIGPPGTGKSQTIANLIAHCLAEGKRVLFVAEKIAALDVVFRRLREVGLSDFCLQLHSNKSRKLDVLNQLRASWEAKSEFDEASWRSKAIQLGRVRDQLSQYVERLHRRYPNGWTPYAAMGTMAHHAQMPELGFSWPAAQIHDEAGLDALRDLAGRVQAQAGALGPEALTSGPLEPVHAVDWSARWQQTLQRSAQTLHSAAAAFSRAAGHLGQLLGIEWPALHRQRRSALGVLARALPQAREQDWSFCARPDSHELCSRLKSGLEQLMRHRALSERLSPPWSAELQASLAHGLVLLEQRQQLHAELGTPWTAQACLELQRGAEHLEEMTRLRAGLSVKYAAGVSQLPVARLLRDWVKAEGALWPLSWMGRRRVRRALDAVIEGEGQPRVRDDLNALVRIKGLREEVHALDPGAEVGGLWSGVRTRTVHARAALAANAALLAARLGKPFSLDGLEPALDGLCGEPWAQETLRLKALLERDRQLSELAALSESSHGLWRGLQTDTGLLREALRFERERQRLRTRGSLQAIHPAVRDGRCGAALQQQHALLQERATLEAGLMSLNAPLGGTCAGVWKGLDTDAEGVLRALKFHSSLQAGLNGLNLAPESLAQVRTSLQQTLSERRPDLAEAGALGRACQEVVSRLADLHGALEPFCAAAAQPDGVRTAWTEQPADDLAAAALGVAEGAPGLNAWCNWRHVQAQARAAGIGPLVSAVESGELPAVHVLQAFETAYARWWLAETVDDDEVLKRFAPAVHERRIQEFRRLDEEFMLLTRQWIRARLCAELPAADGLHRNSEWGVLRHELNKKKAHKPLRQLLQEIPSVVLQLAPCLLMSPLSIAQYLSAQARNFDLVVFDEASQIAVWDAIGAMARGRQVVMVGDPRQLPPTNFFSRGDSAEGDGDSDGPEGDLESILDECLGASLPTRQLSWHYRSRHESLIAFSNHRYYGGQLITFPSPVTLDQAVSFHPVDGRYEKGGARTNPAEARALVAHLVAQLRSPAIGQARLTVGVVTFNAEQQRLIEDLLDNERRQDPGLEPWFAEAQLEPVFVKNLESVQGDERDIVYFSITYGPDLHGAVSMNFGPLNREGGERRLNVAITRARQALRVFSSLRGDQLNLSRTQAAGVRDLKHFLEFAERGPRALAEAHHGSRGDFESPFEASVAAALGAKRWQVHTQIGASTFRVDLGVVHPDFPGRYLAGVECDGATYHRAATARDRDRLREQVLRGLGWEIVRVWSPDWWINPGGTLQRIHEQLSALLEADRARRQLEAQASAAIASAASDDAREAAAATPGPLQAGSITSAAALKASSAAGNPQ
ncbi:MAG: DUF4011 domain-containing protein [Rubrivivax sp.]|nr:DUF4011 domain-containing protein [Rubrivivax sp.]